MDNNAILVTRPVEFFDEGETVRQCVTSGRVTVEVHSRWDDFTASQTNADALIRGRQQAEFEALAAANAGVADRGRPYDPGTVLVLDPVEFWMEGSLAFVRFVSGDQSWTFATPAHSFIAGNARARERIAEWRRAQRPPAKLPRR